MKCSSVVLLFLLAVAVASRPSPAAARGESSGSSIAEAVGRELRGLVARADNIFRSAGWHTASSATEAKNLRAVAARRRARKSGGGARCVTAAMCRKRRVICGKRCYGASRASVNHVPRCVVKCRKCVPTC